MIFTSRGLDKWACFSPEVHNIVWILKRREYSCFFCHKHTWVISKWSHKVQFLDNLKKDYKRLNMISKIRESAVSCDLQDSLVCLCKLSPRRYLGPLCEPSRPSTWFLSQRVWGSSKAKKCSENKRGVNGKSRLALVSYLNGNCFFLPVTPYEWFTLMNFSISIYL